MPKRRTNPNAVFVGFLGTATALAIVLTVIEAGSWPLLAIPAVLAAVALAGVATRALRRASKKVDQIYDDELGRPRTPRRTALSWLLRRNGEQR